MYRYTLYEKRESENWMMSPKIILDSDDIYEILDKIKEFSYTENVKVFDREGGEPIDYGMKTIDVRTGKVWDAKQFFDKFG